MSLCACRGLLVQSFFRGGFTDTTQSSAYFDHETLQQLLEQHLVHQNVADITQASAKLTWDLWAVVSGCSTFMCCVSALVGTHDFGWPQ